MDKDVVCPICDRSFPSASIQEHAERCLFLISKPPTTSPVTKKAKFGQQLKSGFDKIEEQSKIVEKRKNVSPEQVVSTSEVKNNVPLAELMRPKTLDEYVGQCHILGHDKLLRQILTKKDIPSMILWGPPGCGKTSLANLVSNICESENNLRFVKLSATMAGVNDVKEIVKVAKNEMKFKRKTILFMDEIHRFNKLQQDTFLPHLENGTITLIGATTENPSFSLNSALLSRCRVIILEKLSTEDLMSILVRAMQTKYSAIILNTFDNDFSKISKDIRIIIERGTLQWLAEISDGDARIALNSLQIAIQSKESSTDTKNIIGVFISLDDIKDGIKRSHLLYDRKGEEHYNIISAMHKSIRASDDNAALYWLTRMLQGGEDPLYIARRLIRIAGEDIGLADPNALTLAVSCMQGCQQIGMPECDVLLAECAVYMARAPKSTEVYVALGKCKSNISEHKGALPSVPLHLRNAPTKLMKNIGYGKGYNMLHKDESNLLYMPTELEDINFFK